MSENKVCKVHCCCMGAVESWRVVGEDSVIAVPFPTESSARKWAGKHGFVVLPQTVEIVQRDGRWYCQQRGWGTGWCMPKDPKGWAAGDAERYEAEMRADREGWEVLQ